MDRPAPLRRHGLALAQDGKPADAPPGQTAGAAKSSPEEKAIRLADDAFVRDYDKADTKALVARFTEDAKVVEEDGTRYRGRGLIEQRLSRTFAASPGVKLQIDTDTIQFLSPDVVKAKGRTVVTPAKGAPGIGARHTALLVRHNGHWLISSVREEHDPLVTPSDRLKELEWMLGDWVDEGSDSEVRVECRCLEGGNCLIRTVHRPVRASPSDGQPEGRVGPVARQFRSWEFDSEGGFGEGKWSRDGERWVIKHTGVRPEGSDRLGHALLRGFGPT